jgi:hypothetical protein
MTIEIFFIFLAYVVGTYMGYRMGKGTVLDIISVTVDNLVKEGYIRHRKDKHGEIEILKWNDNQNG